MSARKHLMGIIRDRKIHVLMLEAGEDCSSLCIDLLPTLQVLALAAKYQNIKNEYATEVSQGAASLLTMLIDEGSVWQIPERDTVLRALDSAIELNRRLNLGNITRAMSRLAP